MQQTSYGYSARKIRKAILLLEEAPTAFEGLNDAFSHELSWIDPELDMPPTLRFFMYGILNDLRSRGLGGGQSYARQELQPGSESKRLSLRDAESLAVRLTSLLEILAEYMQEGSLPPPE